MTSKSSDTRLVCAPASQVLAGHHVGAVPERAYCTGCDRVLREGVSVVCYAYRCADAGRWTVPCVYCQGCAPEAITAPTLGASEVLVTAVLASVSLPDARTHRLCLHDVTVVAWRPPTEGSQP
jgi:hypothetical protein